MPDSRSDLGPVPEPDFEALRQHLVQLRHARGWSYNELAARSGLGRATVVAVELGASRRTPGKPATRGNVETWYRLAHAFGISLADMLAPLEPRPDAER